MTVVVSWIKKFCAMVRCLRTARFHAGSPPNRKSSGQIQGTDSPFPTHIARHPCVSSSGPQTVLGLTITCRAFWCLKSFVDSSVFCPDIWIWAEMSFQNLHLWQVCPVILMQVAHLPHPRSALGPSTCKGDKVEWQVTLVSVMSSVRGHSLLYGVSSSVLLPFTDLESISLWWICGEDYYYWNWEIIFICSDLLFLILILSSTRKTKWIFNS